MKRNFILDILLVVSTLLCAVTGIVLDFHLFSGGRSVKMLLFTIHKWSGYGMAILVALHFAWHWNWLRHAARTLWKR